MPGITEKDFILADWADETAEKYFAAESKWIDEEFRKNWSGIYVFVVDKLNKKMKSGKSLNVFDRVLTFTFAKATGLGIKRNKHLNMIGGKGFRPGVTKTVLDAVTVTLMKGDKEVAKKRFTLSLILK